MIIGTNPNAKKEGWNISLPPSKSKVAKSFIHPLELAISGFSGSGKTALISKIIQTLSPRYDILYHKHDAHHFEMDHRGKDTQRVKESGAGTVFINDPHRVAMVGNREFFFSNQRHFFLNHDLTLIEGGKNLSVDKILVLDPEHKILKEVHRRRITEVIALVGSQESSPMPDLPYLHRDRINLCADFIVNHFKKKAPLLRGLITVGGTSSRMKKDKYTLTYQGEKQVVRLYRLLKNFCNEVYLSCREDQRENPDLKPFPQIHDALIGHGPLGGILSAQWKYPDSAWLVVAIDMPYLAEETIVSLIQDRNPFKFATCFWNRERNWPEPLCTIYEPKSQVPLLLHLEDSQCPRKFLMTKPIEKVNPSQDKFLFNINTPADYKRALKELQ